MAQLQVPTKRVGAAVVVSPVGQVDFTTVHVLREELGSVFSTDPSILVIDLSGANLLDSAEIGVLVATARRARAAGCAFRLAAPTNSVQRILAVTALDRVWPIYPTPSPTPRRPGRRAIHHGRRCQTRHAVSQADHESRGYPVARRQRYVTTFVAQ
jgi:anti-sigma B factor antagonist